MEAKRKYRVTYLVTKKAELEIEAESFADAKEQWDDIRERWGSVDYRASLSAIEDKGTGKCLFYGHE